MTDTASKIFKALSATQSWLRHLHHLGVERQRVIALIDAAEAQGRDVTIEEARRELADLDATLDRLEGKVDTGAGEGNPPAGGGPAA